MEFQVGDYAWIKVSPMIEGNLAYKYIGPFQIMARIGNVAYKLDLPLDLGHIHDTFHVGMLKRYLFDP